MRSKGRRGPSLHLPEAGPAGTEGTPAGAAWELSLKDVKDHRGVGRGVATQFVFTLKSILVWTIKCMSVLLTPGVTQTCRSIRAGRTRDRARFILLCSVGGLQCIQRLREKARDKQLETRKMRGCSGRTEGTGSQAGRSHLVSHKPLSKSCPALPPDKPASRAPGGRAPRPRTGQAGGFHWARTQPGPAEGGEHPGGTGAPASEEGPESSVAVRLGAADVPSWGKGDPETMDFREAAAWPGECDAGKAQGRLPVRKTWNLSFAGGK